MPLPYLAHTTVMPALDSCYRLWYVTDAHLGSAGTDETAFANTVRQIERDERSFWIAGGDKGEFINISDRRFDPHDCASWLQIADLGNLAQRQGERFLELTRPIWSKCLGSLDGNHEAEIYRRYHYDIGATIAAEMGVPYCRDGFWLRWTFERECAGKKATTARHSFDIVAMHGWSGTGRRPGSGANALLDALAVFNADVVLLGHNHRRQREPMCSYVLAGQAVTTRKRVAVFGGTFRDGSGYSLQRVLPPSEIGAVAVDIWPLLRQVEVRL